MLRALMKLDFESKSPVFEKDNWSRNKEEE